MAKNIAVFGIYPSQAAVEEAVSNLRTAGFRNTDISVLLPENLGSKDLGHEKHTKAPEGATTGAASGAVIGGALGWLAGIGALAIPGIGPLIAAGPIIGMLAGVGAGGAAGGIVGGLIGLGIPEYEAKRYEGRIRKGGILLSVHSDDSEWAKRAQAILEQTGAEDISRTSEARADYAEGDRPLPRRTVAGDEPPARPARATRGTRSKRAAETRPAAVRSEPDPAESRLSDVRPAVTRAEPRLAETRLDPRPAEVRAESRSVLSGRADSELRARDVMSADVVVVDADHSISEAADRMRSVDIGFLPVREGGRIVGVVTDRDITIRGTASGYDPSTTAVSSVMTADYEYVLEDDSIDEVARVMREKQLKRVMVLDSQKALAGVISLGDLANRVGDDSLSGDILERVTEPEGGADRR
ncbi:MAG: CBS domain-containing protein [Bryobacteraceae bacterium]|nr:CBS domain-containing protein [Bryobacteraceae bacterium]